MWNVEVLTQQTAAMCWEACARMMWYWRHSSESADGRRASYLGKAGRFASLNRGMQEPEMNIFYTQLEMRSNRSAGASALRTALTTSPVVLILGRHETRHACLCAGFTEGRQPTYRIVNPCSALTVDFVTDNQVCTASGTSDIGARNVESRMGGWIWFW
jgi:papain like cysteine protease AvrRpt2